MYKTVMEKKKSKTIAASDAETKVLMRVPGRLFRRMLDAMYKLGLTNRAEFLRQAVEHYADSVLKKG